MWQPYLLDLFFYGSLVLLAYAYFDRKKYLIYLSIILYCVAIAVHNSAFALLPLYLAAIIFVLKKTSAKWFEYLYCFGIAIACLAICYSSVFFNLNKTGDSSSVLSGLIRHSPVLIAQNFIDKSGDLIYLFFPGLKLGQIPWFLAGMVFLALLYWTRNRKDPEKLFLAASVFLVIFWIVLSVSFLNRPVENHYYTPLFGLGYLLLSELVLSVFTINAIGVIFALFILLSLSNLTSNRYYYLEDRKENVYEKQLWTSAEILLPEVEAQNTQIAVYRTDSKGVISQDPSVLWVPLEKISGHKFTIADGAGNVVLKKKSFRQTLVVCAYYHTRQRDDRSCIDKFSQEFNQDISNIRQIEQNSVFSIYKNSSVTPMKSGS
ncbi:MAG: hypothetical protein ABI643_02105 [Candidatus Doudnabacteria bacterium]